jgi:hypothetical protein
LEAFVLKRFKARVFLLPVSALSALMTLTIATALSQVPLALSVSSGTAGTESVAVDGKAAAYSQVTIAASALISQDIPVVSLGSQSIRADANGRFHTVIALAPAYQRGIRVTVVASADGTKPVSATTVVDAPNAGTFNPAWDNTQGSR